MADHIANTSPLCYLHRAGVLHVLPAIFGRVIVAGQVVAELGAGRARGYDFPITTSYLIQSAPLPSPSTRQGRATCPGGNGGPTPWTRKGTTASATQP